MLVLTDFAHRVVLAEVATWISVVATFVIVVSWVVYGTMFRWRKTRPGRAVFYLLTALVMSVALSLATRLFGLVWGPEELAIREWLRVVVSLFGMFAVVKLLWGLLSNWRRAGTVLSLEARARRAKERLEGHPETKETPTS